jgi:predicted Rossmann fold nucleotide-binding protein DprA/Smf involved in DNA uptake
LREGARLVTCADDVADELQELLPRSARRNASEAIHPPLAVSADEARTPQPVLTDDERRVMGLLDEERHVDFLIRSSGLSASRVNSLLVGLQLRRMVQLLPGGMAKRMEREHVLRR